MKTAEITVNDTTYKLQHPGMRARAQIIDRATNKHGQLMNEAFQQEVMKHVIVEPKVSFDYFDENPDDFDEVLKAASRFLTKPRAELLQTED